MLLDSITGMIRQGPSKNARELKSRLTDLLAAIKNFRKKTNEEPEPVTLASVLSNLLDEKTREKFIDEEIFDNFKKMATRILTIAHESNSLAPMDIGSVEEALRGDGNPGMFAVTTPTAQQQHATATAVTTATPVTGPPQAPPSTPEPLNAAMNQGPKPAGPNTRCFNCNELGHYSRDCPHQKGAKGKGKNGQAKG